MSTLRNTGRRPVRGLHIARVAAALGIAVAGFTAACADAPTAPAAQGAPATATLATTTTTTTTAVKTTVTTLTGVKTLTRVTPLLNDLTVSFPVPAAGGTYTWPTMGLAIKVPAGAVPAAGMTLTVTALKGDVIAYEFGPSGTRFAAPLTITQSTVGTSFGQITDLSQVQGAYFKAVSQIDKTAKTAMVDELQPTVVDAAAKQIRFQVSHFSGYLMTSGRK